MAALERVQRLEKRLHIINEILDSEEAYVENLGIIITLFLSPLRVNPILEKTAVDVIFSNIDEIRRVNVELLLSLRANRANPGKAFCDLAPFLKLYSLYAENFQRAIMLVQDCTHQNQEFAGFKMSQEARSRCQSLKLEGFLIMPVQRIPRYRLLLEDLLRNTEQDHADYKMVQEALHQVCGVADHMNEYVRQHENFEKMLAIQSSLVNTGSYRIMLPGRRFLKEGRLMKVCRKRPKERVLFLFSDQLVYAKPRGVLAGGHSREGGTYSFCAALPLIVCGVTVLRHHPKAPSVDTLLMIECGTISLVLYSSLAEEVVSWTKAVREAIITLRGNHRSLAGSRSIMLTNALLKGTHLSVDNEEDDEPEEDTSPQEENALSYPLRFSIMSNNVEHEDADWRPDDEEEVKAPPNHSASIDLSASQDVDDILRALALCESEMPGSPANVKQVPQLKPMPASPATAQQTPQQQSMPASPATIQQAIQQQSMPTPPATIQQEQQLLPASPATIHQALQHRSAPASPVTIHQAPQQRSMPASSAIIQQVPQQRSLPASPVTIHKAPQQRCVSASSAITHQVPQQRSLPASPVTIHKAPQERSLSASAGTNHQSPRQQSQLVAKAPDFRVKSPEKKVKNPESCSRSADESGRRKNVNHERSSSASPHHDFLTRLERQAMETTAATHTPPTTSSMSATLSRHDLAQRVERRSMETTAVTHTPQTTTSVSATLPSKYRRSHLGEYKDEAMAHSSQLHQSAAVPETSLSSVKKRRREQRQQLLLADTASDGHIQRTPMSPASQNKLLDEKDKYSGQQSSPASDRSRALPRSGNSALVVQDRKHSPSPNMSRREPDKSHSSGSLHSVSSSEDLLSPQRRDHVNGVDSQQGKKNSPNASPDLDHSCQSSQVETMHLLPGDPDDTVADSTGCSANCSCMYREQQLQQLAGCSS